MLSQSQSLEVLQKKISSFPETVVILGSGWNKVLGEVEIEAEIGYEELFGVKASVPGHEGKLVIGSIRRNSVAFMAGRFHMYEGFSARDATLPIRVFSEAGMKQVIITAASGALNEKYRVGDFVILSDMITLLLSLDNPLVGPEFIDLSEAFVPDLRTKARSVCVENQINFHEGVYTYYHGPSFETPADKMALKFLGGDVVGMSTVPETVMARSLGVKVLGLAIVTNLAFVKHDHKEVLAEAEKASAEMVTLLKGILA